MVLSEIEANAVLDDASYTTVGRSEVLSLHDVYPAHHGKMHLILVNNVRVFIVTIQSCLR